MHTDPASVATRRVVRIGKRGIPMRGKTLLFAALLGFLLSMGALGIGTAVDAPRTLMSRGDFLHARAAIEADTRRALARCRAVPAGAREVCRAEARADERVRKADLQARYHGTVSAADDARIAHVRAEYDIARARCQLRTGDRAECLRQAREHKGRALAQARLAAT